MPRSPLKQCRLSAHMTQNDVAKAVEVTQPTYQRWESAKSKIPKGKEKILAKTLSCSVDQLYGRPELFSFYETDSVSSDRTYFGEVAIHFSNGGNPILVPLTEAERVRFLNQMMSNEDYLTVSSLDNRDIYLRKSAVSDIFFSSEAYDDFGPEKYIDYLGLYPDSDFWKIVDDIELPELAIEEFGKDRVEAVLNDLEGRGIAAEQIDINKISQEDLEKTKKDRIKLFSQRASLLLWQSGEKIRKEYVDDDEVLSNLFYELDVDRQPDDDHIYVCAEGHHREFVINRKSIDFISFPSQRVNQGRLSLAEQELDT